MEDDNRSVVEPELALKYHLNSVPFIDGEPLMFLFH